MINVRDIMYFGFLCSPTQPRLTTAELECTTDRASSRSMLLKARIVYRGHKCCGDNATLEFGGAEHFRVKHDGGGGSW